MSIIIQFSAGEHVTEESNWVDITIISTMGKDAGNGIIRSVSFDYGRKCRIEVVEYWSGYKGVLEEPERFFTGGQPVVWGVLAGETSKWNSYVRVVGDESAIKIGEAQEGLDFLDLMGHRPVLDGLQCTLGSW